jgi:hypothetical protein
MIMAKTPPLKQAPKVKPSRPTYVPDPSPLSEAGKRLRLGEQQGKIYDIAMSKYLSNERLSAAETAALGLNHPAGGGVNLSKLPSEYTAEYDMFRQLKPRKIITPESMLGGASVPLVGDSADAGRRLISVNGIPLSEDINLQGGSRFGRDNPDIWSSGQGVVTVLDNQVERALEGVDKVYGPHVSMSGTGGDFNTMTTKTLLNLFDPADISEESAILFDDRIKKTPKKNKTTGEVTYPFADFVGIHHPELRQQLLSKEEGMGNLRKAFVETMNKAEFQKLGFPEPAAARFATSDRILLDKPIGSTGYEIMQFAPKDRVVKDPAVPHETYPVNLRGEYAGSLADTVPAEVYFKDYYEGRRLMGSPKSSDTRAFTMSSPIQYHDQAWLDNIMGFITARDAKIKAGEYAEGGMVETPTQEAIADTVQNPNAARMLEIDLANLAVMNQPQQPQRMAEGGIMDRAYKAFVPAHARTFIETLAGNESPITEKNFSEAELAMMRDAIMSSRRDRTATNQRLHHEAMQAAPTEKERRELRMRGASPQLDQTVGYQHYPGSPTSVLSDMDPRDSAAIRNTLGRFAYEKDPEGNLIAKDLYKFRDDLSGKTRPSADYADMGTAAKLWTLAKDSFGDAGVTTLPSRVGSAFLGNKSGRPVNVNLGKAKFAGGGQIPSPEEMLIEMMESKYGRR